MKDGDLHLFFFSSFGVSLPLTNPSDVDKHGTHVHTAWCCMSSQISASTAWPGLTAVLLLSNNWRLLCRRDRAAETNDSYITGIASGADSQCGNYWGAMLRVWTFEGFPVWLVTLSGFVLFNIQLVGIHDKYHVISLMLPVRRLLHLCSQTCVFQRATCWWYAGITAGDWDYFIWILISVRTDDKISWDKPDVQFRCL